MISRGDCFAIRAPRGTRGHEQRGARFGVVVQASAFAFLSTVLIAPTSRRARAATFRPRVDIAGEGTTILVEQTHAASPERLGRRIGRLDDAELARVDASLRLLLDLDD